MKIVKSYSDLEKGDLVVQSGSKRVLVVSRTMKFGHYDMSIKGIIFTDGVWELLIDSVSPYAETGANMKRISI